jgi:hypothetical protein
MLDNQVLLQCLLGIFCLTIAAGPSIWLRVFDYLWVLRWVCYGITACFTGRAILAVGTRLYNFYNGIYNSTTAFFRCDNAPLTSPLVNFDGNCTSAQSNNQFSSDLTGNDQYIENRSSIPQYPHLSGYYRRAGETMAGGWNGRDLSNSTPEPEKPRIPRKPIVNQGRNFRASSAFNDLGADRGMTFSEDSSEVQLSLHDLEVISEDNPVAYAHTPELPSFDGKCENYGTFRRDFLPLLPSIPPRCRLTVLRNALLTTEAKRVIEDFEDTDHDTFCKALLALDQEFNDTFENLHRRSTSQMTTLFLNYLTFLRF